MDSEYTQCDPCLQAPIRTRRLGSLNQFFGFECEKTAGLSPSLVRVKGRVGCVPYDMIGDCVDDKPHDLVGSCEDR
jgi:hypothetical protein